VVISAVRTAQWCDPEFAKGEWTCISKYH
jgi:hypothetical protein